MLAIYIEVLINQLALSTFPKSLLTSCFSVFKSKLHFDFTILVKTIIRLTILIFALSTRVHTQFCSKMPYIESLYLFSMILNSVREFNLNNNNKFVMVSVVIKWFDQKISVERTTNYKAKNIKSVLEIARKYQCSFSQRNVRITQNFNSKYRLFQKKKSQ